jgi:hypothetical protein
MVYNTWRYWVFGLCPSSGYFLNNNKNTTFRKLDLFPSSGPSENPISLFIYLFAITVGYDMSETARQGVFYFVCFLLVLSLILMCIELIVCLLC